MASTNVFMVRAQIPVTDADKRFLDVLIARGLLDLDQVRQVIEFRQRVLEEFDRLVEEYSQ